MNKRKTYWLILMLFIESLPLFAQNPFFKAHDFAKEFPNIQVQLIYEDPQGLLWLGTSDGLFEYDGISYLQFLKPDTSSNYVSAVFQDQSKKLWVGYKDGSISLLSKQQLAPFVLTIDSLTTEITGIVQDDSGQIWIATYGQGLFCIADNQLNRINANEGLLGDDIYVMTKDQQNNVWIGTDGGVNICQFDNGRFKIENLTREDGLPDDIVKEIIPDQNGNMWIGMYDNGICFYDNKEKKFTYPPVPFKDKIVNKLALFEDKELWIGTNGDGLWRYSLKEKVFRAITQNGKTMADKVYDLHKDIEGNIWVLTNDHGLCHANRQFEFLSESEGLSFNNIQAVFSDSENNLWIGTAKGLFFSENDEKNIPRFHSIFSNENILSLYEDKFKNIWIGTFGNGVYIYNKKSKKVKRLTQEQDGITNNSIFSINGVNDDIWLATLGGVTDITATQDIFSQSELQLKRLNKESGLGTDFIYKIFIDSKKRVWFATDGKGVSVLENGNIISFSEASHTHAGDGTVVEPFKAVYSITEDKQGHIWFSTSKQGIFEYDGHTFRHLTVKEGIRDLEITSLITDSKGNIVIVHPSGIDLLDPLTHHLIYYDSDVGIKQLDPSPNAVCMDQLNNIWIAGQHNIIRYSPLNEKLEIHPRTRIKSVAVFLEPIDFFTTSSFAHDQNNLVFEYIGIWYTDPETVKYRYQLEDYDLDWIYSADNKVTYSNLPPGDYVFKVMSTENDAFSDEPITFYSFKIQRPFWQRWWFVLGLIMLGGLLFYWYQKQRDQRIQRVNLLEKEKVMSQLEAIKAQINPHFLFNSFNTLITIIEENPEKAVEYVDHLADYYRSILQYRDREVIGIQEEIELIKSFDFLLKKRFGDNFNLDININGEPFFIAPLTLQMLVENAVKHNVISNSKPLFVTINFEKEGYVTVTNNLQEKINAGKGTTFGLQSIQKRYEMITDRKVEIEKTEKYFKVKIPAIK